MPELSAGAITMLILGIIILYGGLGLGIYRAWKSTKAKGEVKK